MDPPSLNRPAVHNPLPTPPQQLHDTFHEKEQPAIVTQTTRPQEKDDYTPPRTIFRKRSHADAFSDHQQTDNALHLRGGVDFHSDFPLYQSQTSGVTNGDAEGNVIDPPASEMGDEDTPESKQRTWERRHPVVKPEEAYNKDPTAYLRLVQAEARTRREHIAKETERREAQMKKEKAKKGKKGASAASAQPKPAKRRRVEEREASPPTASQPPMAPATRQLARSMPEPPTPEITTTHAPAVKPPTPKQPAGNSKLATPPVTPLKIKAPRETPVAHAATVTKTPPKKKVSKANKVVKQKSGPINIHMDAIKTTLNARLEKAGKIRQKNAPELFEDAYIPAINLDGKELVDPSRELQPKALDIQDPCYSQLHPKERTLAERVRATPSEYITQKRRYFLGLAEWWRLGHDLVNPSHAQSFCNQDGNNTSYMHRVYVEWGWADRQLWSEDVLRAITPLTSCDPWVRK